TRVHALELGVGTSSSNSGRLVPGLSATASIGPIALTGTSTGTRTSVYYLSSYTFGAVKRFEGGRFWWGDLQLGFGLGVAYSQYGYRSSPQGEHDVKRDFTGGPLFQFRWAFLDPVYLGMDALFGLRYPQGLLALALQDVIMLSVGVGL
ncbi:MAG TPA: hypothetical protein VFV50_09245, partial [Bdellovibrionales bacterium]|nr:hypothetical protein [Bdellovibrionales bacterium]